MEFNVASAFAALFGTVLGALVTALWINAKMNARLSVVENQTKSLPDIQQQLAGISRSLAEMKGYNRGHAGGGQ